MRSFWCYISLLLMLFSCDSYAPYPVLADEDALLKLVSVIGESDSTVVYVSKEYMITHDHRLPDESALNSSLRFIVNGENLEYKATKDISDLYVIHHQFRAGDRIEVFCSAPGLPDVTAVTVIPEVPSDLIKDFSYTVEDGNLKGGLVVNSSKAADLHLSADLGITEIIHIYKDDVYASSRTYRRSQPFSVNGSGEWVFDYQLPKDYVVIDNEGKVIRETTEIQISFNLDIISEELYFARLHQQSSSMSPSSYTNVKGGLGYVGAFNRVVIGTFKSDAQ